MTEEMIFAEALERSTPVERAAYLDEACAGDAVLRQRLETLLRSHEADGDFLGKPAIQCAAEELAGPARAEDTQAEAPEEGGPEPLDFLASSDRPDSLGRLGHYEVLEVIGKGGMGVVLRAFDERLHRVVAIKVMAAQLATNATARKRFTREAQAAAAVSHDHIVTIHAVEETGGSPYLVMQYVSGMSLQQRLDSDGPLEVREVVRIGMQAAAGLAAAHAHGMIHRDIKPANILLENGVERVKVTDFGLARAVADASLTQSGVVAGTPQYMSPEQARGEAVDQRSDLFSLGSVLYAMCTGRPPFRSTTSIAVLKRVCDDTPSAIREANPEVPDWLVGIVTKLHAKDRADRFQSAAEVAELLKEHLAHLQHPSVVPLPAMSSSLSRLGRGARGEGRPRGKRLLAVAAAVLLCLIGGLSLTEATGVTNLRSAVVRVFTPDGTLVVEVDDPGVKVTIEGDGGIVITGAGPQEVRLRPGSYTVRATRDGKPVREELVTITRGDKQVVKVSREPPGQPLAPGEFRRFAGLRGVPMSVAFSPDGQRAFAVSGGEFKEGQWSPGTAHSARVWHVESGRELACFKFDGSVTNAAVLPDGRRAISVHPDPVMRLWDIESGRQLRSLEVPTIPSQITALLLSDGRHMVSGSGTEETVHVLDLETGKAHRFKWGTGVAPPPGGEHALVWSVALSPDGSQVAASGMFYKKQESQLRPQNVIQTWDLKSGKESCLYEGLSSPTRIVVFSSDGRRLLSGSLDGTVRLWDVATGKQLRIIRHPAMVEGVALSPDGRRALSAGWQDKMVRLWDVETGQQLGYYPHPRETWCVAFSPDGRRALSGCADTIVRMWELPETGAGKAAKPDSQAFVVLGGKGVAERKFDTLAEAVQGASDGDTIEVRGNGPFVSQPITIGHTALTIRGGAGFLPVITLNFQDHPDAPLLQTCARLVLEGLEFRRSGPKEHTVSRATVRSEAAPLYVANCRFFMQGVTTYSIAACGPPVYYVRNSLFLGEGWNGCDLGDPAKKSLIEFDNCVIISSNDGMVLDSVQHDEPMRLTRNTVVASRTPIDLWERAPVAGVAAQVLKPRRLELSANIFVGQQILRYIQAHQVPTELQLARAKARLQNILSLKEERNLYSVSKCYLHCYQHHVPGQHVDSLNTLAEWGRFWRTDHSGSVEGHPRYHGGNLLSKLAAAPGQLTPADFRLRPDSPGYKAGKDGKDLGADVDLVGPGPAYERWKKTPAYQQWLKDSEQLKK